MRSVAEIKQAVSNYFKVGVDVIDSKTKKKDAVKARHTAMYLVKDYHKQRTLKTIAEDFGRTDHSTIHNAIRKINDRIDTDKQYRHDLFQIRVMIEEGQIVTA